MKDIAGKPIRQVTHSATFLTLQWYPMGAYTVEITTPPTSQR